MLGWDAKESDIKYKDSITVKPGKITRLENNNFKTITTE